MQVPKKILDKFPKLSKEILINKIEDSECEPKRVKIDGSLVIRGSARLPKEWK